jgi:hypothetical protein
VVVGLVFWTRVEVLVRGLFLGRRLRWLVPVGCVVNFFGCAWCRWLPMLLGHFLFGFQENGTISHVMVSVSFVEHAVEGPVLRSTPTTTSI